MNKYSNKIRRLVIYLPTFLFFISILSTNNIYSQNKHAAEKGSYRDSLYIKLEIPDTLQSINKRANFFVAHFWDDIDLTTLVNQDSLTIEQVMSDYLSILSIADTTCSLSSIDSFVCKLASNKEAYYIIYPMVEKYLNWSSSPIYNQFYFIKFLDSIIRSDTFEEIDKSRPNYLLNFLLSNRLGDNIAEFSFAVKEKTIALYEFLDLCKNASHKIHLLRDYMSDSLFNAVANGGSVCSPVLLIYFYDPDCSQCDYQLFLFSHSSVAQEAIKRGSIIPLAVNLGSRMSELDKLWINSVADRTSVENKIDLSNFPAIYLIDTEGKILLKSSAASDIINYLME